MTIAEEKLAVCVRDAWKRYSPKVVILKSLNMSVVEGSIYGLLGPSGCGKTSLLSCIVGVRSLDSGTIEIAATRKVEVGFMPQDITLNKEFTVSEVFHFYGVIYGMSEEQITRRGAELVKFLQIPNDNRYIGNCSGGQQRRISMAVTLLHDPKILILDEPTVGVDPVLCADIWEHFLDLVQTKHKTIIITTHYIEEAKNANRIGLMRGGILLAEEPPLELLRQFNSDSLEAVFLKLSAKQETDDIDPSTQYYPPKKPYNLPLQNEKLFVMSRFKAQMVKNINWTRRNLPVTAFVICLPALLFFIMGHLNNVKNGDYPISRRPLALVNDEVEDCRNATPYLKLYKTCQLTRPFSCRYIDGLHKVFKTIEFDQLDDAKEAVRHAHAYGVLMFRANFSQNMMMRLKDQTAAPKQAIEGSDVLAFLDMSEYGYTVRTVRELGTKILDLLQDICEECGYERKIAAIPIHVEQEVYTVTDIVHCFVPPYFGSVAFYTTTMFTSSSIVMERSSGLFERSKIAGLTMTEIIAAHVVVQFIVMMLQNALSFVILYVILNNPMVGNAGTAWLIMSLNQFAGMVFGFFLAILIRVEKNVAYAGISTVLTLFMLTGTLWPIQGIHWLFRPVSAILPVRYSGEAYLNVAVRGYTISHIGVVKGLVAPVVASVTLIVLSVLAVKTGVGSMD